MTESADNIDVLKPLNPPTQAIADAVAQECLAVAGPIGVAYSGGVDSAVLAALTARAIGREHTILLMAVSPSLARRERTLAHRQASELGIRLIEVETHEVDNPDYAANPVDRCYFCKDEMFARFEDGIIEELGLAAVAYGENSDDAERPDRPGARAAREHAILRPLATSGATKADVRAIARQLGLPSADKPAAPCLASRIPHGEEVTAEKLEQVDLAEDAVFAAGFSDCRVRHHRDIARIEIPADEFGLIADTDRRNALLAAVREAGFKHAVLDLAGIQSGAFTMQILSSRPGVA